MSAAGVSVPKNVTSPKKSSNPTVNLSLDLSSKNANIVNFASNLSDDLASDSAAVALSISDKGLSLMKMSMASSRNHVLDSVLMDSFSTSNRDTTDFQRQIAQTVSDIIRPYDTIEEARSEILEEPLEIETAAGTQNINGLSIKLAYELNSYLSSFGANNEFFNRLETSIKNTSVVDSPIVTKVLSMIDEAQKGNEIDVDSNDLRVDFSEAINETFETVEIEPLTDYSENQKLREDRLLTYDTIFEDKVRNSATLDKETMKMLFTDESQDAKENEDKRVNAGREILKRTLMIRESIDKANEIIKSLAFKDMVRHMEREEELENQTITPFVTRKEGNQNGNANPI